VSSAHHHAEPALIVTGNAGVSLFLRFAETIPGRVRPAKR
jgi:hypothetical protein